VVRSRTDALLPQRSLRPAAQTLAALLAATGLFAGGCGSSGYGGNRSRSALATAGNGLSYWTFETGRLAERFLTAPVVPAGGVTYDPALALYFTVSLRENGFILNYFADPSRTLPAGHAAATVSPGGDVYPKTVVIDNALLLIGGTAVAGRVVLSYPDARRPSREDGALNVSDRNSRAEPVALDLTVDPAGAIAGGVTSTASASGRSTTANLTGLSLDTASLVLTGSFAATGTTVAGTFRVNPNGSGALDGVDPNVGRYRVSWSGTGTITVAYPDRPDLPPANPPWYLWRPWSGWSPFYPCYYPETC
jgi:hypothetical protein